MADQLFKKRQMTREDRKKSNRKLLSETWLFVCEGSKTEPNYIKKIVEYANDKTMTTKLKITIVGKGKSTVNLIKSVDNLLSKIDSYKIKSDIPYGKIFVLFDRDSFGADNFNNAIKMADSHGYIPIWSNECFELWYILHYDYYNVDSGREMYFNKLSEYLNIRNYKDDKSIDVFSIIHSTERIETALRNAEKLSNESFHIKSYAKRVPCTQVFVLIRKLEKRLKIDFCKN